MGWVADDSDLLDEPDGLVDVLDDD